MSKTKISIRALGSLAALFVLISVITVTLFYYKTPQGDDSLLPSNIMVLTMINVNVILGIIFFILLFRNIIKLYFERKSRIFGASFRSKMTAAFLGFSLIPTILLFVGASGVLTSVIENWLSIQMEAPLRHSLEIARGVYEDKKTFMISAGEEVGMSVRWNSKTALLEINPADIEHIVTDNVSNFYLVNTEMKQVYGTTSDGLILSGSRKRVIGEALEGRSSSIVESGIDGDLVSGIVPITRDGIVHGVIITELIIDPLLVKKMEGITRAFQEFHQLKSFKNPLKASYMLSIFIITLVILFSATWFGFYLGKGITVPIMALAEATQKVAKGNYDFKIDIAATSEIRLLVNSFNQMTVDLKRGKEKLEQSDSSLKRSYLELDIRRDYIETVLQNIATGVISLDNSGYITTFNRSAEKILSFPSSSLIGIHFRHAFIGKHMEKLVNIVEQHIGKGNISTDINITVRKTRKSLRMNIAPLYGSRSEYLGSVIVFDDLSELIRVQKVAAWEGVARRIAHEIKNPLTPIQLSTERLRKKFFNKADDFDDIFDKSTKIIINEVHTLKTLVNEFSEFSRLPTKKPVKTNLNSIINDVVSTYRNLHQEIDIRYDPNGALPEIMADAEQMKRVFVNLLENAVEAIVSLAVKGCAGVDISTIINDAEGMIVISVSDEGPGINESDLDKLFIPYFSQKKTGTGLGLAIVEKIIHDHNGTIRGLNNTGTGASFIIELPV